MQLESTYRCAPVGFSSVELYFSSLAKMPSENCCVAKVCMILGVFMPHFRTFVNIKLAPFSMSLSIKYCLQLTELTTVLHLCCYQYHNVQYVLYQILLHNSSQIYHSPSILCGK